MLRRLIPHQQQTTASSFLASSTSPLLFASLSYKSTKNSKKKQQQQQKAVAPSSPSRQGGMEFSVTKNNNKKLSSASVSAAAAKHQQKVIRRQTQRIVVEDEPPVAVAEAKKKKPVVSPPPPPKKKTSSSPSPSEKKNKKNETIIQKQKVEQKQEETKATAKAKESKVAVATIPKDEKKIEEPPIQQQKQQEPTKTATTSPTSSKPSRQEQDRSIFEAMQTHHLSLDEIKTLSSTFSQLSAIYKARDGHSDYFRSKSLFRVAEQLDLFRTQKLAANMKPFTIFSVLELNKQVMHLSNSSSLLTRVLEFAHEQKLKRESEKPHTRAERKKKRNNNIKSKKEQSNEEKQTPTPSTTAEENSTTTTTFGKSATKELAAVRDDPRTSSTQFINSILGFGIKASTAITNLVFDQPQREKYFDRILKDSNGRIEDIDTFKKILDVIVLKPMIMNTLLENKYQFRKLFPLTHVQELGLKHFEHLKERIPRSEVAEHEKILKSAAKATGLEMQICGSYRRGRPTCGDVDCIVWSDEKKNEYELNQLLSKFLGGFYGTPNEKYIVESFAEGDRKFMGLCKIPDPSTVDGKSNSKKQQKQQQQDISSTFTLANLKPQERQKKETEIFYKYLADANSSSKRSRVLAQRKLEFNPDGSIKLSGRRDAVKMERARSAYEKEQVAKVELAKQQQAQKSSTSSKKSSSTSQNSLEEALTSGKVRRLDIRVVPKELVPTMVLYFTGSASHNVYMRQIAIAKGMLLNEYGLFKLLDAKTGDVTKKKRIPVSCEADVFKALGMDYVEPKNRE